MARRVPESIRHVQNLRVRRRESVAHTSARIRRRHRAFARARHCQRGALVRGGRTSRTGEHARVAVSGHHSGRERTRRAGDPSPASMSRAQAGQFDRVEYASHVLHERVDATHGVR